jgi:hypothetical protein
MSKVGFVSIPQFASEFDTDALLEALGEAAQQTADEMVEEYNDITATWQHPVTFEQDYEFIGEITIIVATSDPVFQWVSEGTGETGGNRSGWYPIQPVRARSLAFPANFAPKTAPNMLGAQPGGQGKFGPMRVSQGVNHPGITPRQFHEDVGEKYQPILEARIRAILLDPRFF